MSFSVFARKVRDTRLPYGRRVSALRSCVQMYRPIGFHASLSFLEELAGPLQREESLLRALDALIESRDLWKADDRAYAATRRRAKHRGRRSPRPQDPNPSGGPDHWYGARVPAALHALRHWNARIPADEPLKTCVTECLASGGPLTAEQRQTLTARVTEIRRRLPGLYDEDRVAFFHTRDLLKVARFIEIAAGAT